MRQQLAKWPYHSVNSCSHRLPPCVLLRIGGTSKCAATSSSDLRVGLSPYQYLAEAVINNCTHPNSAKTTDFRNGSSFALFSSSASKPSGRGLCGLRDADRWHRSVIHAITLPPWRGRVISTSGRCLVRASRKGRPSPQYPRSEIAGTYDDRGCSPGAPGSSNASNVATAKLLGRLLRDRLGKLRSLLLIAGASVSAPGHALPFAP